MNILRRAFAVKILAFSVALLAARADAGLWNWFRFTSAGYELNEKLSDKGARRGTWGDPAVPDGASAAAAEVDGRKCISFAADDTLVFKANQKSGDSGYSSYCDLSLRYEGISGEEAEDWEPPLCDEKTRAAIVVGYDKGKNPSFFGYTGAGWVQLAAEGVTPAFGTWYDFRMQFVTTANSMDVTYFVKSGDGYVKLTSGGGLSRFACAGEGRSWSELCLEGTGAVETFGANNGAGLISWE